MVQLFSLLTSCALLVTISAAPLVVPIGNTGKSLSFSEDGESISIGGLTFSLNGASSCAGRGGKKGAGNQTAPATINAKAVYFLTNAAKNSIVALRVAADGTLSDGSITGKFSIAFSCFKAFLS